MSRKNQTIDKVIKAEIVKYNLDREVAEKKLQPEQSRIIEQARFGVALCFYSEYLQVAKDFFSFCFTIKQKILVCYLEFNFITRSRISGNYLRTFFFLLHFH